MPLSEQTAGSVSAVQELFTGEKKSTEILMKCWISVLFPCYNHEQPVSVEIGSISVQASWQCRNERKE